ncbi:adenine deaminase [Fusobacterium sp.]|uniref:adenine deaminase n=1 Tax=Fusobacterium sp. TaxID=68766 RepID=UPI00260AEF18|nr:adenine deaminase [Fusobacterium sp.]
MDKLERRKLIETALGRREATLKLENANLVNVFSGEIYMANIYLCDNYIADVVEIENDTNKKALKVIDLKGKYLAPGFIDSHLHIESSHLTPYHFAEAVIPKGTTTIIADPHEIGNALGEEGVDYMLEASQNLPMNQYFLIPSCVPSVVGLETTGAELNSDLIDRMLDKERILGLGEVMDFVGVINSDKRMEDIIDVAYRKNKFLQGHAPEVVGDDLSAYLCGGPVSCHEVRNGIHAKEKIRKGMVVDARESSISKNITSIVENVKGFKSPRNLTLCTDDREPKDILGKGHINDCVRVAVKAGLEPIEAIRAVTLNTAQIYNLEKLGAIAPGYKADMVVFDNLNDFNVEKVFYMGKLVAEDDKMLVDIPKPEIKLENKNTVTVKDFEIDDFKIKAPIENGTLEIIGMEYISKERSVTRRKTFTVNVKDGYVDLEGTELNFVAVVNRYPNNDNIALAIVENFYMEKGAVGTTYSHDSHNMTIIYNKAEDAQAICKRIAEIGGGVVVVENGKVVDELPFPIAGMLSKKSAKDVSVDIERMNNVLREYGIRTDSPITRPSTLALIVIPDVKMSDLGLIDVLKQEVIKQF